MLHLVLVILTILAAWRWGDWRNWHKYHTTMIYMVAGSLLYSYLYNGHKLWQYKTNFLVFNNYIADALTTFIILPLTALIFLTNYPDTFQRQLYRTFKFVIIYFIIEWLYYTIGVFSYSYGWNIWWSLGWNFITFPMLELHHKKPLIAYGVSILIVILMLVSFHVSF